MLIFPLPIRESMFALCLGAGLVFSNACWAQVEAPPEPKADAKAAPDATNAPDRDKPADQQKQPAGPQVAPKQGPGTAQKRPRVELGILAAPSRSPGVLVNDIRPGGAADQAGIRRGDFILSIGDKRVNSPEDLVRALGNKNVGDEVTIEIWRDGANQSIAAKLQEAKAEQRPIDPRQNLPDQPSQPHTAMKPSLGEQDEKAPWIGLWLDEQPNPEGVAVQQVFPSGPAARAGVRPGDVIVSVADKKVASAQELIDQIAALKPNDSAAFTVNRGGQPVTLKVSVGQRSDYFASAPPPPPHENAQQGHSAAGQTDNDEGDVPDRAMVLEQNRRFAEQHERLEKLILELRDEVRQLREELQKRDGKPAQPESAPAKR